MSKLLLPKSLLLRAKELTETYPDSIRHPIVVDNNDDIQALSFAAYETIKANEIPGLRVMAELLFVLGYEAGRGHIEIDKSI